MQNTIVIISPFTPKDNIVASSGGGMSYNTYNTIKGLLNADPELNIILLAEKDIRFKELSIENRLTIIRCWERSDIFLWGSLLKQLVNLRKKNSIKLLVEFEFAAYGNMLATSLLPVFLLISRILGFKPNLVVHQVLLDLNSLKVHLGISNIFKIKIFSFFLKIFYILISNVSSTIIVFEEILKLRLEKLVIDKSKLFTIPLGIIKTGNNDKTLYANLRKRFNFNEGDFVIVLFGYIAWYKGSDWLVKAVQEYNLKNDSKLKLILAGGESSTLKDNEKYRQYFNNIVTSTKNDENIVLTGYVPDKDIDLYFEGADLHVFPYRVLMSSSGPISLVFSYSKPYIISNRLLDYFLTEDVNKELSKDLKHNMVFDLSYLSFEEKINHLRSNPRELGEIAEFSGKISGSRDWSKISIKYINCIK